MYNLFSPSYTEWKDTRTAGALTAYYVQYDLHYVGILVDKTEESIFRIDISRDGYDPNLVDFETNIKPTAVLVPTVDDAIAIALQ
jgi:hypothetical protein